VLVTDYLVEVLTVARGFAAAKSWSGSKVVWCCYYGYR